ncbi:MAG: Gfo/Idh/MocA family oxidoreductase [Verrucomicrobiales bacterium]|nr:Gfo/Idh/MocA family oxidoreductase [Verrucomicrobiales bacterium]
MSPASITPVRLGIAGFGNVLGAYWPVVERLRHLGHAQVIAGTAPERHRFRAADLGIPRFDISYVDFLNNSEVDAVIVLTPMQDHASMVRAALEAGKHVLVEKPLATDLDSARQLIELARTQRRLLCCAPFTVLSPTFQTIARRIDRGDLGRVVAGRGRYGWAGPDWTGWFYKKGGGALFDLGVYNLTTLTGWLGPARRVTAMSGVAIPQRLVRGTPTAVESEDNVQVILDFGDGCLVTVFAGFTVQQYRGPGIELYGTEGTLNLLGDDWDPDGYELWRNAAGCWELHKETHPEWPWTDGLRHWVDCIRSGAELLVSPDHAYHVIEIMTQAQASARDGTCRPLHSRFHPPRTRDDAGAPSVEAHRVHDRTRTEV